MPLRIAPMPAHPRGSAATREHASHSRCSCRCASLWPSRSSPWPSRSSPCVYRGRVRYPDCCCQRRLFVVAPDSSPHGPLTTLTRPRVAHRPAVPAAHHRLLPSLPLACPGCWMDQRVDQMDRSSGWAILWVEGRKPATMAGWSLERNLPELAQATATKPAAHHRLLPSLPRARPGCWRGQRVDQMDRSSGWAIPWG